MENRLKMFEEFYHIFDQWITLYENGVGIDSIFKKNGFQKVAIYGMGTMAMHLIKALENSNVQVVCAIDKYKAVFYPDVQVVTLEDVKDIPDVVIYTNPNEDLSVIEKISKRLGCSVFSLADIIFDNI